VGLERGDFIGAELLVHFGATAHAFTADSVFGPNIPSCVAPTAF
jgi:hypothetical protein